MKIIRLRSASKTDPVWKVGDDWGFIYVRAKTWFAAREYGQVYFTDFNKNPDGCRVYAQLRK